MSVDVDALRRVLEYVTEHPEEHDQGWWAQKTPCGTTACLAGHAVQMNGYAIHWWGGTNYASFVVESDDDEGEGRSIEEVAADIFGVPTMDEAYFEDDLDLVVDAPLDRRHLFDSKNTLADLWHIASRLTDGAIEVPEQFRSVA